MSDTPIFASVERDLEVTYDALAAGAAEPSPESAAPAASAAAPSTAPAATPSSTPPAVTAS